MTIDILNAAMIIIFAFWATAHVKNRQKRLTVVLVIIWIAAVGARLAEGIG